jgi:hypothetical protein
MRMAIAKAGQIMLGPIIVEADSGVTISTVSTLRTMHGPDPLYTIHILHGVAVSALALVVFMIHGIPSIIITVGIPWPMVGVDIMEVTRTLAIIISTAVCIIHMADTMIITGTWVLTDLFTTSIITMAEPLDKEILA